MITTYYTNHYTIPKVSGDPPIQVGKRWTTRLVVDHFHHDEIEKRVAQFGPLTPHERMPKWAAALSDIVHDLGEKERNRYTLLAETWNANGPPEEIQKK